MAKNKVGPVQVFLDRNSLNAILCCLDYLITASDAPNLVVLKTMRFYMISFSGGYMPIRKKNPSHILTWQNDAELDKLAALNAKINEGATLNSLRSDMAEKEEAVRRICITSSPAVRTTLIKPAVSSR